MCNRSYGSMLCILAGLLLMSPASMAAEPRSEYHAVTLGADGKAAPGSLDALVASLSGEIRDERTPIVVMVHGFRLSNRRGIEFYTDVARRLRRQADAVGLKVAVVGVHWDADPGAIRSWMPQAFGQRVASLLGFRHALKNPYLEKVRAAREAGPAGLRAVLFRLQEAFPGAPIHVFAHSLGAELIISALAPEAQESNRSGQEIEQPGKELRVEMVVLAGADLDEDLFVRRSSAATRVALQRAQVWWVTVPEPGKGDGMLELRRGAGRGHAIGERGLQLAPEDLDRLVARGGLVLDEGNIPTWHRLPKYYNDRRLKALAASLLFLQQPDAPAARESRLAALDAVLHADPEMLAACAAAPDAGIRIYASWLLGADAGEWDHLRIVRPKGVAPERVRQATAMVW